MAQRTIGGRLELADGTCLPLSKAVRAGDLVLLYGQLGLDSTRRLARDDIESRARQCLANVFPVQPPVRSSVVAGLVLACALVEIETVASAP
jgi:enamine deaminase RidA (YjgF/YER057c/UK114 family)